jgi:AraC-like DNA-binding protein
MNNTSIRFYLLPDVYKSRFIHGVQVCQIFPPHIHQSFLFGLIEQGECAIGMRGKLFHMRKGACFLLSPEQPPTCQTPSKLLYDYRILSVHPEMVQALYSEITGVSVLPPEFFRPVMQDQYLSALIRRLGDAVKLGDEALTLESLCVEIVGHSLTHYARAKWKHETFHKKHLASVDMVKQYLDVHFDHPVRLDELAQMAHFSPFYLNRLFQQAVGLPPYEYLIQIRVKHAQAFLRQGESIANTAYLCGFSDQNHLTRIFTRHVGITPGMFLNSAPTRAQNRRTSVC